MRLIFSLLTALSLSASVRAASTAGNFLWVKDLSARTSNMLQAYVNDVKADASGNVVVAGGFSGAVDFGAGSVAAVALQDVFLAKYSGAGALLWLKHWGTSGQNSATSLAIDGSGNLYLSGSFAAINFGGGALVNGGLLDIFIAKFDASGNYVWAVSHGGTGNDYGTSLALDLNGDVLVSGTFQYTVDFGSGPLTALSSPTYGSVDIWIGKYAGASGACVWAERQGGPNLETTYRLAADPRNGDVVITGSFFASTDLGGGTMLSAGTDDIFVAKYSNATGAYQWQKRFGDVYTDSGHGLVVDSSGNIYMTGQITGSVNFGNGALVTTAAYGAVCLVKFSETGTALWSRKYGGSDQSDFGASVALDAAQANVIFTGYTSGSINFGGGFLLSNGAKDIFVASETAAGAVYNWARRIGGIAIDAGTCVAVASNGYFYSGGSFQSSVNFGGGTVAVSQPGATDGFVLKLNSGAALPPVISISAPTNGVSATNLTWTFTGTATDAVDGSLTANIGWHFAESGGANQNPCTDCLFGAGGSFSVGLEPALWTVRAMVTNSLGLVATNTVTFTILSKPGLSAPCITIQSPVAAQSFLTTASIPFLATVTYASGSCTTCCGSSSDVDDNTRWYSSIDGLLGGGLSLSRSLSAGSHTISVVATDNHVPPQMSTNTVVITVAATPPASALALALACDKASYVRHATAVITATVTSGGVPVAGAAVQAKVSFPDGGGSKVEYLAPATSNGSGKVVWNYVVHNNKAGIDTVTAVAAKAGYASASAGTTFAMTIH